MPSDRRLRLGVVKLASCDGCQLTLLDLEDQLLDVAERFDIVEFAEASSVRSAGPYDVLLVEGSVSTPDQEAHLRLLRSRAATLVAIGSCATAGGIQALRNWAPVADVAAAVYPSPEMLELLATVTPLSDTVHVDLELPGCPIDPGQLVEVLTSLRLGRRPTLPDQSVCFTCKRAGFVCVAVAAGETCLGPVTRTGCGAICPAMGRGCYGCFGPWTGAAISALADRLVAVGSPQADVARAFAGVAAWAPPIRLELERRGWAPDQAASATMVPREEVTDARDA